jgi:hypothetical protein
MSWSSSKKGLQIKPKVFISATLYDKLVENNKKLNLLLKEKGTAVKAEFMSGEGDLPPPVAGVAVIPDHDHGGAEDASIVQKELGRPVDVTAPQTDRTDLDVQPGHSYYHDGHKSRPSTSAQGPHSSHSSDSHSSSHHEHHTKKIKIDEEDYIPLIKGKPWYFLGLPARFAISKSATSDDD